MLRPVVLAAAMVLCVTTLELRPVHAQPASAPAFDVDGGVRTTARSLRVAFAKHGLDGKVWLGKLGSVGGNRDTLVYVPRAIDPARTIDLVVYMEGHGSFADDAMDHRHAASIARLRGNRIYVAPDAPSSAHGTRKARTAYWQPGCAERRCAGGHSAPGDFLVFLVDVRARVATMIGTDAGALDLRLSLIGFSNGGKGVVNAMHQLASAEFTAGGVAVRIADVVFADANYGDAWLARTWQALEARPEAPRLTILLGHDAGNRRRAAAFRRAAAPDGRLRVISLRAGHHPIGDAAVDYLVGPAEPVARASP
jgi:hypothetical protein